jgi:hypothetical protein
VLVLVPLLYTRSPGTPYLVQWVEKSFFSLLDFCKNLPPTRNKLSLERIVLTRLSVPHVFLDLNFYTCVLECVFGKFFRNVKLLRKGPTMLFLWSYRSLEETMSSNFPKLDIVRWRWISWSKFFLAWHDLMWIAACRRYAYDRSLVISLILFFYLYY